MLYFKSGKEIEQMLLETMFTQLAYQHKAKLKVSYLQHYGRAYSISLNDNYSLEIETNSNKNYTIQTVLDKLAKEELKIISLKIVTVAH